MSVKEKEPGVRSQELARETDRPLITDESEFKRPLKNQFRPLCTLCLCGEIRPE
jgi:hypothetical protein